MYVFQNIDLLWTTWDPYTTDNLASFKYDLGVYTSNLTHHFYFI